MAMKIDTSEASKSGLGSVFVSEVVERSADLAQEVVDKN